MKEVAFAGVAEFEFEAIGKLPAGSYSLMFENLSSDLCKIDEENFEEVDQESFDEDGLSGTMSSRGGDLLSAAAPAADTATEVEVTASAGLPARKRKLEEIEISDRHEHEEDHGDLPRSFGSGTLEDFYAPLQQALVEMKSLLEGPVPIDVAGMSCLASSFLEKMDELKKAMLVKPRYGLLSALELIRELESELTNRADHSEYCRGPGPLEWALALQQTVGDFSSFDEDEQADTLRECGEDMEMQVSVLEYCLEILDDRMQTDVEERRAEDIHLQRELNRRLAASLVSKV